MLDEARQALRITSHAFDDEIVMLINACKADMELAGVSDFRIVDTDPLVKVAICAYVKAYFGQNPDSEKFLRTYNTMTLRLRDDRGVENV